MKLQHFRIFIVLAAALVNVFYGTTAIAQDEPPAESAQEETQTETIDETPPDSNAPEKETEEQNSTDLLEPEPTEVQQDPIEPVNTTEAEDTSIEDDTTKTEDVTPSEVSTDEEEITDQPEDVPEPETEEPGGTEQQKEAQEQEEVELIEEQEDIELIEEEQLIEQTETEETITTSTVILHIRFQSHMIFEGEVALPTQDVSITDANGTETSVDPTSVLALLYSLDQENSDFNISELTYYESYSSFFLNCIEVVALGNDACGKWIFAVNDEYPYVGMDAYALAQGDDVYIFYGSELRAYAEEDSIELGTELTAFAQTYDYQTDTWNAAIDVTLSVLQENPENPWAPIVVTSSAVTTDGSTRFELSTTGTYMLGIDEDYFINTYTFEITEQLPPSVMLVIRHGESIIYSGEHTLTEGASSIVDSNGISVEVQNNSALGVLYSADQSNTSFEITNLTYYEAFDSFLLSCIDADSLETPACDNWHYAVDNELPYTGMNAYTLSNDQQMYVYFGNTREVQVSSTAYYEDSEFTLQAKNYLYETNTWEPLTGVTIAITQTNPDNPWEPLIIATSTVNTSGQATFALSTTGTYYASLVEDFYFPSSEFQVISSESPDASDNQDNNTDSSCSNCSSGGTTTITNISSAQINAAIDQLLSFIKSNQLDTGEIVDGPTSEWLAMSFASKKIYPDTISNGTQSLYDAIRSYDFGNASDLNTCAAYPRHILALLSSGVSKESELITETAEKMQSECASGASYGASGINDDIFALLALLAIDTQTSNEMVKNTFDSIKADQTSSGAFTWSGFAAPDATGAAINALKYAQQKGMQVEADVFDDAKTYLKQEQLSDGGWGYENSDVLTTSWVMMGLNALNEGQSKWSTPSGKNPWHVLVDNLQDDGSYTSVFAPGEPDWFAIKHAVPALSGKSWPVVLSQKTSLDDTKPTTSVNNGCASCETTDTTSTTTNSTTTTPSTDTQTPTTTPTSSDLGSIDPIDQTNPTSTESFGQSETTDSPLQESNTLEEETEPEASLPQATPQTTPQAPTPQIYPVVQNNAQENADPAEFREENTTQVAVQESEQSQQEQKIEDEGTFASTAARGVFNSALAGSAGMGLFLAWRFARTLL